MSDTTRPQSANPAPSPTRRPRAPRPHNTPATASRMVIAQNMGWTRPRRGLDAKWPVRYSRLPLLSTTLSTADCRKAIAKKAVTAKRPNHKGNVSMCILPISGAYARFDITRKALHDTLHLGYIGGHDIEYHVANAAIGIATEIVLDRRRATSKRLARGTTVMGKGKGSPE